jgi:hypothetical protein
MASSPDLTWPKPDYHSAARFALRMAVLTLGLVIIIAAALVLNVFATYLQDRGAILHGISSVLRIISYGLLILDAIWFAVLTLLQSWRFFKESCPS